MSPQGVLAGVSQSLVLDALRSCGITAPGLTDEETGASSPQEWTGSWGTVDPSSGRSDPKRSPPGSAAFWSPLRDSNLLALPPLPGGLELGSGSLVTTPTFLSEELSGLLQDRTHAGASCLGCAHWIPVALDPGSHQGEDGWRAFGSETFLLPETTSLMFSHWWTPRKQDGLSWLLPEPVMAALLLWES